MSLLIRAPVNGDDTEMVRGESHGNNGRALKAIGGICAGLLSLLTLMAVNVSNKLDLVQQQQNIYHNDHVERINALAQRITVLETQNNIELKIRHVVDDLKQKP
jgi:hypothetical protein